MSTKGTKLADAGRAAFQRGNYKDAIEKLQAGAERLVADGELINVCATLRLLVEVQIAARLFADALATTERALTYALNDDISWVMMDRANVHDAAGSFGAVAAWREAATRFAKSPTTLSCLAHAAGAEIRHRRVEGFTAARELASQWPEPIHHITIAGDAGLSAGELGVPLLAQALRIMLWNRRIFPTHFFQAMLHHVVKARPDLVVPLACIGSFDSFGGFPLGLLPSRFRAPLYEQDPSRLQGYPELCHAAAQLKQSRGHDVSIRSVPFDHWLLDPAERYDQALGLDRALAEMVPNGWWIVAQFQPQT